MTTDKKPNLPFELICNKCGAFVILLATSKPITPECKCGSRSFTVNPTEH